jgi:DNA-binding beta-propeller fold protein YncE
VAGDNIIEERAPKNYTKQIIFLLIVVAGLLYLYFVLNGPVTNTNAPKLSGYTHLFSVYGNGADRLNKPTEVAVDKRNGDIYVADTNKSRIMVFDKNGAYVSEFGKYGTGKGEIKFPNGVALDSLGRVYVTCYTLNKIMIYSQNHKPYWEINLDANIGPMTSTIKGDKIYIATRAGVMIGNLRGNLLQSFYRPGSKDGQFNRPSGIAVGNDGSIYLADSMNYRVEAIDKKGKFLWAVGKPFRVKPGQQMNVQRSNQKFSLPESITMAPDGNLYVMDAFTGEVHIFSQKGKELGSVGEWGQEDGQFYYPGGISSVEGDKFAIADKFNDRVQVVRIPSPTAKATFAGLSLNLLAIILLIIAAVTTVTWIMYKRWRRRMLEAV